MRWFLATLVAAGCSDPTAPAADAAAPDARGPTRPYALAASGAHLVLDPAPAIVLGQADLAEDVDAVLVHQEFYGLPWDAFEAGDDPPAAWVATIDALVDDTDALGKPVVLALQLVSGNGRQFLADRYTPGGNQAGWSSPCYDFATEPDGAIKQATYVAYVDWMVRRFHPRWVNVAIEINLFAMGCPDAAWDALVGVERAAYDAAKAADPDVIAFPSIQNDVLLGYGPDCTGDRDACFDAGYAKLALLKRDRFAVTSMPFLIAALRDPADLPDDWFTRAGARGDEQIVIAEAGFLGTPLVARVDTQCITAIDSDEATQLAFFEKVVAHADEMELITWPSDRDLGPAELMTDCPCDYDADWCGFLEALRQSAGSDPNAQASAEYGIKQFGAMGLRDSDGVARAGFKVRWDEVRALPWVGSF